MRAILVLLLAQLAAAQAGRVAWVPNPRVRSGGWVSDASHHLRPATIDSLNRIIGALEASTTAEIGVAVVDSTSGLEAQEFATALHRAWGVGKRGKDNGVLLLWDPVHRAVFISVGYGLEGAIPDRRAGRIRDLIIAQFRESRFDEGMIAGVTALADAAREEGGGARQGLTPTIDDGGARPSRRGGGGFSVFIGTILASVFAGIGGLVGWRRWKRYRPRTCSNGHPMRRLGEREDDDHLDSGAKAEERVHSIDWDVWVCRQCGEVQRIPFKSLMSAYTPCPECHRRTAIESTQTLVEATYVHGGRERVTKHCENCGWKQSAERDTPRKEHATSSSSSSGFSGGGGGGGGGGSSFGGGSAGGGGAGGHY